MPLPTTVWTATGEDPVTRVLNALTPFTDGPTLVVTAGDGLRADEPATTDGQATTEGRGLVVVDLESDGLNTDTDTDTDTARAVAGHIAPGGLLAVLTRCSQHDSASELNNGDPDGGDRDSGARVLVDPTAAVITAVRAAGLAYLQHVVILAHPLTPNPDTSGNHIDHDSGSQDSGSQDGGAARTELLVFRRPVTARSAPAPLSPTSTGAVGALLRDGRGRGAGLVPGGARVWCTAQQNARAQRVGRYVPDSVRHPARMMPALAAHAVAEFTRPGELVADPLCGIGTTLVEAVRAGRRALGVEYEAAWAELAETNLDLALADGHRMAANAWVLRGDARALGSWLDPRWHAAASLVLLSPPYGHHTHGQVRKTPGKVVNTDHAYSDTPRTADAANLAQVSRDRLVTGFTDVLRGAALLLRPGGHLVIVVRPWRQRGELVDLPGMVAACVADAGLVLTDRAVSLLARVTDDGQLVARPSFFQNWHVARNRDRGLPTHLIAHEDVLVARLGPRSGTADRAVRDRPGPVTGGAAVRR